MSDEVCRKGAVASKAKKTKRETKADARPARRWRRWGLRAAAAVVLLALMPVLLTLLYAIPFVHPVSTLMLRDLVTLKGYERQWADMEDITPVLVHSVIMSEDGQFCTHHGVDLAELNKVIDDALEGEAVRGASTITMQLVKNLYLWPGRSYIRKALEIPYAVMVDAILPKYRIMEIYLNIAELGDGVYGVEAGAQAQFQRSSAKLSARQAALLTASLPNPHTRIPSKPSQGMQRVARVIERRAAQAGGYVDCVRIE
ncbi:MAG: monofunctional biosynthetic peptidoglycan transglycosylase [Phyllobacteriaceae bacterium]|nr:monofunctional biosynthetic peptidoglycan transglycosylase [Phyllobacteriaceae bacterium]MBA92214.1 monofunctional biosynthetic peptidoglycan transglycosylase [Phyllobacteriaceae bacterium]